MLLFEYYKGWYNTISYCARFLLPVKDHFTGVIYNTIDLPLSFQQGGTGSLLLFLWGSGSGFQPGYSFPRSCVIASLAI
jgi:hypothetical protein